MTTSSSAALYDRISRFAALLRKQGLRVGLAELQDVMRAMELVGFEDREVFRITLRALLAKSPVEQKKFDDCFEIFFVSKEEYEKNEAAIREAEREAEERRREIDEELQFNGKPIDIRDDLKDVYGRMPQSERDRLQKYLEQFAGNEKRSPKLYEGFIRSIFMRSLMEQQMMMEDAADHSEGAGPEADLMFRDISNFTEAEIPRAYQLIDRLTRQINGEVNAKKRGNARENVLDFKRTIRAGLSTGGHFHKLVYRRKHQKKKRVVLLCDVSGSMLQFSEFAIRFIKSMSDVSEHSEVFLFSEIVQKVSAFSLENMDLFTTFVKKTPVWGKGTNVGRALEFLEGMRPAVLNNGTVLLILSDAKTVDLPRAQAALARAEKTAGSVVWMNPIPQNRWEYLKSIVLLKEYCNMVPCSTLNDLARACARLI